MTTQIQEKSIFLFMTEGSSDKEYHVHLRTQGDGWVVQYANGPRGRVGKTNLKTKSPVDYEAALGVYNSTVKAKKKDGYTEAQSGVRFTNFEGAAKPSGHVQQLPSPIDLTRAEQLLKDDRFALQEKANGERCSIEVIGGIARGINKLGLYRNLPENVAAAAGGFGDAFFDGEIIGDEYHAFDLLRFEDVDLKGMAFEERYRILYEKVMGGIARTPGGPLQLLHASFSTDGKLEKFARIQDENREGVVFKEVRAPYGAGRTEDALKFKFKESATCIVIGVNAGRSVSIGLLNAAGELLPTGNLTILANFPMPVAGDLAEVQFLYFNPGGAFEQPVYLGPRSDITVQECLISQVTRLKPGVSMDEMGRRIASKDSDGPAAANHSPRRARI